MAGDTAGEALLGRLPFVHGAFTEVTCGWVTRRAPIDGAAARCKGPPQSTKKIGLSYYTLQLQYCTYSLYIFPLS